MTLILTQREVRELLPMGRCIERVTEGFRQLARGEALNPLRSALWPPDQRGLLGLMPGYVAEPDSLGVKVVSVFPGNHGTKLDAHQGFVALFDAESGVPEAIVEASSITSIRTAAASAVATDLLARKDSTQLALLGSGVQAAAHVQALCLVRELTDIHVYSPSPGHAQAFCESVLPPNGVRMHAAPSARAAVERADIVCTVSSSKEPILEGAWLRAGTHINAVGSSVASARELDDEAFLSARLFVDRRESTLNESGDYLMPAGRGLCGPEHILAELGELLEGQAEGRQQAQEITLYKSLGLAVQDLINARFVVDEALRQDRGTHIDLSGKAHAFE